MTRHLSTITQEQACCMGSRGPTCPHTWPGQHHGTAPTAPANPPTATSRSPPGQSLTGQEVRTQSDEAPAHSLKWQGWDSSMGSLALEVVATTRFSGIPALPGALPLCPILARTPPGHGSGE